MVAPRSALMLACFLCGCSASIEYGRPDPAPRPSTPEQACYQQSRIEVADAEVGIEWGDGSVTYRSQSGGLAFYRDGKRLGPGQVLAALGDPELRDTYHARRRSLARARRGYGVLTLAGLAISVGGVTAMTWAIGQQKEGLIIAGAMTVLGLGAALTLRSQSRWSKWKGMHQAYDRVFVDATLADRLYYRLERHERAVAKRCDFGLISVPTP